MPVMTWNDSLDVGVDAMNAEHRDILSAMNAIYDLHNAGRSGDVVNRAVAALGGICARHFADEEKFMAKIGFPGLKMHRHIHEKLLERFTRFASDITAAGGEASEEFFDFLRYWLTSHIKGIDTKYGAHAASRQAPGRAAG